MKKTQWIDLWHTILNTKVSFIAIILFIQVSVIFYFGLGWTSGMVDRTVDYNFQKSNTRDVEIFCSAHLSDDDIDTIRSLPGVDEAEGIKVTYYNFTYNNSEYLAYIREITDTIDKISLSQGRLPEKENELAVDLGWAKRKKLSVGDVIEFYETPSAEEAMLDELSCVSYTITGFVTNPAYSCTTAGTYGLNLITGDSIDAIFYGTDAVFADADSGFRSVLITGAELENLSFNSSEYTDLCSNLENEMLDAVGKIDEENYNNLSLQYAAYGITLPEYAGCVSQSRSSLRILVSVNLLTDILNKLSVCLSVVFIIIGFLISYIAITRLIHSQKKIIGMKKAFGLTTRKIVFGYTLYTGIASVIGFIFGLIMGFVVEWILCSQVVMRIYCYTESAMYADAGMIVIGFFCVIAIIAAITVASVISTAGQDAVELMNDVEKSGYHRHIYENLKLWNRMSMLKRMIINNCLTDHRRVFGTIVSVACCMALMTGAVTFYYNVSNSTDAQFENYFHFHLLLEIDEDQPDTLDSIAARLEENNVETLAIHFERAYLETKEHTYGNARMFVLPDDENADRFINLQSFRTAASQNLYEGISAGMAFDEYYGADSGDCLQLVMLNGKKYSTEVNGYFYSYLLELPIVFTEESYAESFGETPVTNALLVLSDERSDEEIEKIVSGMDGLVSITNYYDASKDDFSTFEIIVTVISAIYIVVAVVTAALVLLNILFQFVLEKKKELIVMQINGYDEKYARQYIFFDTVFLTAIGILPGALIGAVIGYCAVSSFDSPFVAMMKTPVWAAFAFGFAGTVLLSLVMCLIAMIQIHRFDISDINK